MGDIAETIPSRRFNTIKTRHDLVTFRLGAALSMEYAVLELLSTLEHEVHRVKLKELFSHHADETYAQIENLEQAFGVLGTTPAGRPCLAIEAIDTQRKLDVSLVGDRFADTLILAGAAETAHHVIAMYESLITLVRSIGPPEIAALLRHNLQQEQYILEEVEREIQRIARVTL